MKKINTNTNINGFQLESVMIKHNYIKILNRLLEQPIHIQMRYKLLTVRYIQLKKKIYVKALVK